ncbi:MAG: glycosyltransferase family 4 protein [Chloroflexi bacterium]|nr:glycosyltransferase family 4 protein [Chloroflexota bacterium]MCI0580115.1 glycosyltransferase family 4 protein [Chloroflexota bacterium]MCI0649309.1 glycosyltransferase family 4 protein [Chloroflexota bacterium]MCI0725958.1 glycosyltransferase family 4 protein [Chloroflexota bacterium]
MIYIDVSAAVHSRAGIGRYSKELAQALVAAQPGRFALFHNQGRGGRLPESLQGLPRSSVQLGYKPWRMAILLAHLGRLSFHRLLPGVQLFHSTEHLLMPLRGVPTVFTVHDLIYKLYPAYHKKLNYWFLNLAMPLFCRRATAIIGVSEASRRDIIAHYGVDPAKIHVVYEAAAPHFRPPGPAEVARARQQYGLPERFLLHLGTIEPRKNLDRLVDALQQLRREFPDLELVLAGGKGWLYDDFFARLAEGPVGQAVRPLGWVPDEELPAVIAAARLAVQPSLYEGFGLPILEHMATGQVVAASHSSSHLEIGGEAAAYFDPADTEEMVAVIGRLLASPNEYEHRRQLGLAQASQFSWQRAAEETIAVYDQLIQK